MTSDKKPYNDVQELVSQLHIDGMQYREFHPPKPAPVRVVGGTSSAPQAPAAVTPTLAKPVQVERPVVLPVAQTIEPPLLRAAAPAAPLAFTFERLRRQALGSKVHAPSFAINLPARAPAATYERAPIRTLPLAEVFARLNAASDLRNRRLGA